MTRFLTLVLTVATSVSLAAATFDSFPSHETAVSDPTSVAADDWQTAPSVAAGDGMFLVAWYHARTTIYAARVSGDGELLDTQPILITRDGIFPRVAWAGDRFLLAWSTPGSIRVTTISSEGEVSGERAIGGGQLQALTCHQTGCLVVSTSTNVLYAFRTDTEGNRLAPNRPIATLLGTTNASATTNGTGFLVAWRQSDSHYSDARESLHVAAVGPDGDPTAPELVAIDQSRVGIPVVASDGSAYVLVYGLSATVGQRISANGKPVGERTTLIAEGSDGAVITHTGDAYLVLKATASAIVAVRVRSAGNGLETSRRTIADVPAAATGLAVSGGHQPFVAWVDAANIYGNLLRDHAASASTRVLVSRSAPSQRSPDLASDSETLLVAWNETAGSTRANRRESAVGVTLFRRDGRRSDTWFLGDARNVVSAPATASNRREYLVVWTEGVPNTQHHRVVAARVGSAGPVGSLTELSAKACPSTAVSTASNGRDFLVAWNECGSAVNQMHAALIVDGVPLAPFPLAASAYRNIVGEIAANGHHYLVSWIESKQGSLGCDIECQVSTVRAIRIGALGSPLDSEPLSLSPQYPNEGYAPGFTTPPRAAWSEGQFVIAWLSDGAIYAARVGISGAAQRAHHLVESASSAFGITATDTGLAIVWHPLGANGLYATELSAGQMKPKVFLGITDRDTTPAVIAPDGRSIIVAYRRLAHERVYSAASRVFVRGIAAGGHRRAVRR